MPWEGDIHMVISHPDLVRFLLEFNLEQTYDDTTHHTNLRLTRIKESSTEGIYE
jgi:hypothetical protein